ncbi:hypothetical protein ACHAPU_003366 [Fusarium lateritium]
MAKDQIYSSECSETYWPVLKSLLASEEVQLKNLQIPCNICYEEMTIHSDERCEDEHDEDHRAMVLRCGHIFGKCCVLQSLEAIRDRKDSLCCPQCRADLQHDDCYHFPDPQPMPNTMNTLDSLPLESGPIKDVCRNCFCEDVVIYYHMRLMSDKKADLDFSERFCVSLTVWNKTYHSFKKGKVAEDLETPAWVQEHFRRSIKIPGFFEPENDRSTNDFYNIPDDAVITCHIVSDVPPVKPLPFLDWVQWACLQDGAESKTVEELRVTYERVMAATEHINSERFEAGLDLILL